MLNITSTQALRLAEVLCDRDGTSLVLPGDPRREMVLRAMQVAHFITRSGWDYDHARDNVSVTLPGIDNAAALALLGAVPLVGPLLVGLAVKLKKPAIFFSPAAMRDPVGLLGTLQHERGHIGSIKAGGLGWCLGYGLLGEVKAGAEAPCYGVSMAHRVRLGGVSVDDAERDALASLAAYGADDALVRGIIASNAETLRRGGDPGGVVAETLAELAALEGL